MVRLKHDNLQKTLSSVPTIAHLLSKSVAGLEIQGCLLSSYHLSVLVLTGINLIVHMIFGRTSISNYFIKITLAVPTCMFLHRPKPLFISVILRIVFSFYNHLSLTCFLAHAITWAKTSKTTFKSKGEHRYPCLLTD